MLTSQLWEISGPSPGAPRAALLFPFAGGGAHAMDAWYAVLGERRLVGVQYPGRGRRLREPLAESVTTLAAAVASDVREVLTGHSLLMLGHSMGALVAYETARQLQGSEQECEALVVSAALPPLVRPRIETPLSSRWADLSDDELAQELHARAGLPAEVLAEPELLALTLPTIRHDFEIAGRYARTARPGLLEIPVLAVGGRDDVSAPPDLLHRWSEVTRGPFAHQVHPGGHFYFRSGLPGFAEVLSALIRKPAART